jgi:hypothetical protein
MNFGNIEIPKTIPKVTKKPTRVAKQLKKNTFNKFEFILKDERNGDEYYLILTSGTLSESNLKRLSKEIEDSGINSYLILAATFFKFDKDDVKAITAYMLENDTGWKSYIDNNMPKCIITLGSPLYQIIKSADVTPDDFMNVFCRHHLYIGHDFIGKYDCAIVPCHEFNEVLHSNDRTTALETTYKTQWFRKQLKYAQTDLWIPDTRDYNITIADGF